MDHPPYLPFTMLGFVMLADVVGALAAGLDAHTPGVRIMNLVGPEAAVTEPTADVLARVLNQLDADLDLSYFRQPGNEHATVFDITRIQQDLGYTFQDTPRDHLSKE
jgi:nucleoside-diphosphate-sugar epimerase